MADQLKPTYGWQPLATAPKDGTEFIVRYPLQGNVKRLVNRDKIHHIWESKGQALLGLDYQQAEWHPLPPDAAATPPSMSGKGDAQ